MNLPLTMPVPLLKNGDRLTREEFERRYDAMPDLKKAELIDGVVYMPSPVRYEQHAQPDSDLNGWLAVYRAFTPGVGTGSNATVRLDMKSEPQPDDVMFIKHGGQTYVEDDYITGTPELAAEVSASTIALDKGPKLEAYRRNGVREYILWRIYDREIDWFVLRDTQYERLQPNDAGIICSMVFPGLWLDTTALLNGELQRVHEVLQQGLRCPEHQAFVLDLRQRADQTKREPQA